MPITSKQLLLINSKKKSQRFEIRGTVAQSGGRETKGVDLRKWFLDSRTGKWTPTKQGIFLTKEDFYSVLGAVGMDLNNLDPDLLNFLDDQEKERIPILGLYG